MDTTLTIVKNTLDTVVAAVTAVAPTLLATTLVVVVGLVLARTARALVHWTLERVQFEQLSEATGLKGLLLRAEVSHSASGIIGLMVYWTLLAVTALAALDSLGFADASTFSAIGAMIPKAVAAVAILAFGLNIAAFLAKLVQTVAVNAELRQARLAHHGVFYAIAIIVVITALGHVGVPEAIVTNALYIALGSVGVGMALAFGLGNRELAAKISQETWKAETVQAQKLSAASELGTTVFPSQTKRAAKTKRGRTSNSKAAAAAA